MTVSLKRKKLKSNSKQCASCSKDMCKDQRLRGRYCNGDVCMVGFALGNTDFQE